MDKDLDLEKLSKYSLDTWLFKQGEMVSLVIHLGNRLGPVSYTHLTLPTIYSV